MNPISTVASGVVAGIWKLAAIALLALLLLILSAAGTGWWMLTSDLRTARADLATEVAANEGLRGSIREQNRAVEVLAEQKRVADARGAQAQQLAAANGKRFDLALRQVQGAHAATCADAMPAVNSILEAIR